MKNKNNDVFNVVKYGDPILRKKVDEVIDFSNLSLLLEKMYRTMYNEHGIGLAANQVGISLNILVIDTSSMEEEILEPFSFINSHIIESKGLIKMEEGCLSVPDIRAEISRPETITIRYQDVYQKFHTSIFSGISARVIQHELDHLDGKFFTDYLSPVKKSIINKRLLEISKNGQPSTGIIV
jgi:peptide deformylase